MSYVYDDSGADPRVPPAEEELAAFLGSYRDDDPGEPRLCDRALAAAQEPSTRVAVNVWCAAPQCTKKGKVLGQVRRSSAGLVFDAVIPSGVYFPPGRREALLAFFRRRGHVRLPFAVGAARCCVLLEEPPDPHDHVEPRVECPRCGVASPTRPELIAKARSQRSVNTPATLGIPPASYRVR